MMLWPPSLPISGAAKATPRRILSPTSRPSCKMLMFIPNGGLVAMFQPPAVQGVGSFGGFQFMLQDGGQQHTQRSGSRGTPDCGRSARGKDLTGLLTTFSANDPQVLVTIDREKAKAMNIPLSQITDTLSVFMGSQYINDFDFNNRTYRVFVQADQPFRMTASDLHSYYVRSTPARWFRWTTWSP
jgi:HAE1 family hydrophobic/amphiphilic exporter-1